MNNVINEVRQLSGQEPRSLNTLELTDVQLEDILFKVVLSIPEKIFYLLDKQKIAYIVKLIASEFVLFQAVERLDDAQYPICFTNFIIGLNQKLLRQCKQ